PPRSRKEREVYLGFVAEPPRWWPRNTQTNLRGLRGFAVDLKPLLRFDLAGRLAAWNADLWDHDGMQVECVDLRREAVEFLVHVVQLPLQHLRPLDQVARGLPFVGKQRPVQMVGVLADPLFAGDRPALLGGDDLLLHRLELSVQLLQRLVARVRLHLLRGG